MARPTLRRLTSAAALTALALGVLPASSALAAPRDIEDFACPAGDVPDPGFSDDNGNFHEDAIHCIVWYGLAQGTSASTYSPDRSVNRGQMASFIARLLEAGAVILPSEPEDHFDDDDGTEHEERINQLAELGVVEGTSETTYEPGKPVNRAQMASFLARAYEEITGQPLPEGEDAFTDDEGNFHEDNINRVAEAGIAAGTTATTYSPANPVKRDQMASFLARELDLLVEEGSVDVPRSQGDNQTALDVPELLRVELANATTVRFVFDEALNDTVSDDAFGIYSADATRTAASSTSRFGDDTVLATFTAEAVESAVLGAVAAGAVQDADANTSTEGYAALQDVELEAATTDAPDLRGVTVAENRAVFTFDEAAFNVEPTGYHLVLADGTVRNSTAVAEGDGTDEHTVTFALTADEVADVAYGYVDPGTVSDTAQDDNELTPAQGELNVLQEEHVSSTGQTNRPDLTSATVVSATQVRYVFDEQVTRAENQLRQPAGAFRVYFTDGSTATAESAERSSNNTFTATFAAGTLDEFVAGAQVAAGTVQGANGTNQPQEVGFPLSFTAGDTAAPELLSATIGSDGENRVVRYVFDEEVASIVNGSRFKVYQQDGTVRAFTAGSQFPPSSGSCTVDADNAKVVNCVLSDEADPAPTYAVAAVERNAVTSDGGHQNPEGAAVLRTASGS